MRLNGFEVSAIYYKNTSALPSIVTYNVSTDLPHSFDLTPSGSSEDIYLAILPGYIYNISCRGSWNILLDGETPEPIVSCGCYGGEMEILWTGHYSANNANHNNKVYAVSAVEVVDIMFTNMDYNHGYSGAPYDKAATSDNMGAFVKLQNKTDHPLLLLCKYFGRKVKWSDKTQQAWYSFVDYFHIDQITDTEGEIIVNRYCGYHDKYELMKYLNAYWDSLELFNDSNTWELDKELALYQDDDTWA